MLLYIVEGWLSWNNRRVVWSEAVAGAELTSRRSLRRELVAFEERMEQEEAGAL